MRIDQASGNSQDGAEATKESEDGESDSEEDDSIEMQADNTETVQNTQSTLPINANHCCCSKNMAAIFELSYKFAVLEAKFEQRQLSPSYDELLTKVRALEDERDSLLTALRLLKEDFDQSTNDHSNQNTDQDVYVNNMDWQEVKRNRRNGNSTRGRREQ